MYSNQEGSPACTPCPSGKINAEKRSTSVGACADCPENTVPNKPQSECVDPSTLKGIGGVPSGPRQKTEGGTFKYDIYMNLDNKLTSETVTVSVSSIDPRCIIKSEATIKFSKSNWNQKTEIIVKVADDKLYLKKDSLSYTCLVTHTLQSSIGTKYSNRDLSLEVTSSGCGNGEYLGEYKQRQTKQTCICNRGYFYSKAGGCIICPIVNGSDCSNNLGLTYPLLKQNFWRANMTSDDLSTFQIYPCTPDGRCLGSLNTSSESNSSDASCAKGYATDGPICAICAPKFIMSDAGCVPCPSRSESSSVTGAAVGLCCVLMLLYMLGTW